MTEKLIIYDFETTGLDPLWNQPIEVSVKIVDGESTEYYHAYIKMRNPLYSVPEFITGLTGITNEMLYEKGRDIDEVFKELHEIFSKKGFLVVGYNIGRFDNRFLSHNIEQIGKKMPYFEFFDCCSQYKAKVIGEVKTEKETYMQFHDRVGKKRVKGISHKLIDAVNHYGIPQVDAFHGAKADVDYTHAVYLKQREEILKSNSI